MKLILILFFMFTTLFAQPKLTVEYFEDITQTETIQEICTQDPTLFKPMNKSSFGFNSPPIWLKVTLRNTTEKRIDKIFEFPDIRLNRIEIYKGDVLENIIGDMLPFNNRNIKNPSPAFSISADANSEALYYLRVMNTGSMNLRYVIYNHKDYEQKIKYEDTFYTLFFGAAIIMILYNLILFLFIKEIVFFNYVVYHSSLVFVMLYYNGILLVHYLPDVANLNFGNVPIYLSGFTVLIAMQFARGYLRTDKFPKLDKYILFLMLLSSISILLSIFDLIYIINNLFSSISMAVESLLLFGISIYLMIVHKNESAKFYFIGWGIMLLAVVMISLINIGVLSRTALTSHIFQIASLFELLLLSMGLAFRYNLQHKLIVKQKQDLFQINRTLEQTISDRTQELHEEVQQTKVLLKDRDILFKELYHRVKNNLQMMVSILSMQKRRVEGGSAKGIIEDITGRIKSLALIHEKLQASSELDSINMREYLTSLLDGVKNSYQVKGLELMIDVEDISMSIDQVTSVGLIVNELTNNSFKHAFKDTQTPRISLSMTKEKDVYHLEYSDNGKGSESTRESKSLGSTLIKTLTNSQLKGSYTINTQPSVSYSFTFPL